MRDLSDKLMLTLKDTCNWTEMCEMSYDVLWTGFKPVRQNTKPVLGLTSGLRALRAVRSEQLLGSFGNAAISGPKAFHLCVTTKKKPPEVLRLRTFRGSYSTKLIKTVSLNGHICHICKQTSSNFQTFLETSMDFSMDFFVPNYGTLPVKNHWIHLSFHWGVQSYFQYYAKLANQQNMLQDGVRTSTYNRAIAGKLSFLEGRPKMFCGWEAQRWEARKDPESCCNFSWSYMKSEKNSPLRTSDLDFRSLQPSKTIQDTNPYATAVSMSRLRWKMSMTFKGSWPWIWVQEVASFPSLPCRWPWVHGGDEHLYRTSYKFGTSRGYQALDPIPNDISKCRYLVTYEHIQAMIIGKTCKNHDFPWIKHSKTHG